MTADTFKVRILASLGGTGQPCYSLAKNEERVSAHIARMFDWGMGEIIVSIVTAGSDASASRSRTLDLLAKLSA